MIKRIPRLVWLFLVVLIITVLVTRYAYVKKEAHLAQVKELYQQKNEGHDQWAYYVLPEAS